MTAKRFLAVGGPLSGEYFAIDPQGRKQVSLVASDGRTHIYELTGQHPAGDGDSYCLFYVGVDPFA